MPASSASPALPGGCKNIRWHASGGGDGDGMGATFARIVRSLHELLGRSQLLKTLAGMIPSGRGAGHGTATCDLTSPRIRSMAIEKLLTV